MLLPAFQQSIFLQSLGWAIANSVWQGGMLWIFYKIIITSYTNASASFKNNLSTILLFGNLLWFIVTFFSKVSYLNSLSGIEINSFINNDTKVFSGNTNFENYIYPLTVILPYLSLAYLLLLAILAVKLADAYRHINFIKRKGLSQPSIEWITFVKAVSDYIGITKKIKIWLSQNVDVPATIGFLKPVILIPLASLNQLNTAQVEAIILHELSHIKRNDYLTNLLITLIETILFFNPFVVLLCRIIKKERENCCDDFVLEYQYDPHSYASALLLLEQSREQQLRFALTATSGRQQLFIRIKRIMEVKNNNDSLNYGQKLLALLLSTGIIFSIAWLTPEKKTAQRSVKQQTHETTTGVTENKEKTISVQLKMNDQKNNLFAKSYIEKDNPTTSRNYSETTIHITKKEKDAPPLNIDSTENTDEIPVKITSEETELVKEPLDIALLNTAPNITLPPKLFLEDLKLLEDMHFNIDINKTKAGFENGMQLSAIDWSGIKETLFENLKKIKPPGIKVLVQGEKLKRNVEKELKEKEHNFKLAIPGFSADVQDGNKRNPENDALIYLNNNGRFNFFYNTNPDNFPMPPPPPPLKKRKPKLIAPPAFEPAFNQNKIAFQDYTPQNVKTEHSPSVSVDLKKSLVIVNGEKINLADLKKSEVDKIIKNILEEKAKIKFQSED